MLHGASSDGVFLAGDLGAADMETACREMGLTAEQCAEFLSLMNLPELPPISSAIIRGAIAAAIMTYGTKGCASVAQGYGVPAPMGKVGCAYLIGKIMPTVNRLLAMFGQPVTLKANMLPAAGPMFSRPCNSPAELLPGEHFMPAVGPFPSRCERNVAILAPTGKPVQAMVYVPCENMPKEAVLDVLPRAVTACRDRDGKVRATGVRGPLVSPGLYTERYKPDQLYWPGHLEAHPWQGDEGAASVADGITVMNVGPIQPADNRAYPPGAITAFDAKIGAFRIAIPAGLSGAAYREIATSPSRPDGVTEVDLSTYERQTGTAPWWKSWKLWTAVAVGGAVIGGGVYALARK